MVLQNKHCIGLQACLNAKEKSTHQGYVVWYLNNGVEHVYSGRAFREAVWANLEKMDQCGLQQLHSAAVRIEKRKRTKWQNDQKESQVRLNKRRRKN